VVSEKIFRNRPTSNKNCQWQPCLLTNRDEMSNLYRGPSIHAFYQISVHSGKRFQRRRFFRNQPIRNNNGLWRPCLLTDRNEMSNLYRGPSKDASYQVSVHLAKRFHRRFLARGSSLSWACVAHLSFCTKFRFVLANEFQRKRFLESDQFKTRIAISIEDLP
jgi:hypothetical protein